jgi:rubredoxin/uncharacterized membrane protein
MMEKTWRCTVCGYLHTGDDPPDVCPVCGVDASHFELVVESHDSGPSALTTKKSLSSKMLDFGAEMKATFVPHAVAAHFPNGLLPTCVLFLFLTFIFAKSSFESTTFHLLLVIFVSIPITIATGLFSWKKKYAGKMAPIFRKKLILAALLLVLMIITVCWRWANPNILSSWGFSAYAYSILILIMLLCVTLLGHFGGVLVFSKQDK